MYISLLTHGIYLLAVVFLHMQHTQLARLVPLSLRLWDLSKAKNDTKLVRAFEDERKATRDDPQVRIYRY